MTSWGGLSRALSFAIDFVAVLGADALDEQTSLVAADGVARREASHATLQVEGARKQDFLFFFGRRPPLLGRGNLRDALAVA